MIKKKINLENSRRPWKTFQNYNKRRAFNRAVGYGKKSKISKPRTFVYSGLQSSFLSKLLQRHHCTALVLPAVNGHKDGHFTSYYGQGMKTFVKHCTRLGIHKDKMRYIVQKWRKFSLQEMKSGYQKSGMEKRGK